MNFKIKKLYMLFFDGLEQIEAYLVKFLQLNDYKKTSSLNKIFVPY